MAQHHPTVTRQVQLQAGEFGRQIGRARIVHDEDHFAAILDQRHFHTGVNVAVATVGVRRVGFENLVLESQATRDVHIDKTCSTAWQNHALAPHGGFLRFSIHRVTVRHSKGVLRPTQRDLRGRSLDLGADLHGVLPRRVVSVGSPQSERQGAGQNDNRPQRSSLHNAQTRSTAPFQFTATHPRTDVKPPRGQAINARKQTKREDSPD